MKKCFLKPLLFLVVFLLVGSIFTCNYETTIATGSVTTNESQPSDWAVDSIKTLSYLDFARGNLLKGFTENMKRDEFTALLTHICERVDLETNPGISDGLDTNSFNDIDNSSYIREIRYAQANALIEGVSKTKFAPASGITREQISVLIYRLVKKLSGKTDIDKTGIQINDMNKVSIWATEAVYYCYYNNIMRGNGVDFRPKDNITKQEAETVICRTALNNKYFNPISSEILSKYDIRDDIIPEQISVLNSKGVSKKPVILPFINGLNKYFDYHTDGWKETWRSNHGGMDRSVHVFKKSAQVIEGVATSEDNSSDAFGNGFGNAQFSAGIMVNNMDSGIYNKFPYCERCILKLGGNLDTFSRYIPSITAYLNEATNDTELKNKIIEDYNTLIKNYGNNIAKPEKTVITSDDPYQHFDKSGIGYRMDVVNIEDEFKETPELITKYHNAGVYNMIYFRLSFV